MSWLLGQERGQTPQHEVRTYFGKLEENELVIERCETFLTIGTYEAEGANEDPGWQEDWNS